MNEGEGRNQGSGLLSESSSTIVESNCTIYGGHVGARELNSPTIQGRRKKTLNRTLVAQLKLGGNMMSGRCPTRDPTRVSLSSTIRICGLMSGLAPLNRTRRYRSISQRGC
jgi:hypothetical protein